MIYAYPTVQKYSDTYLCIFDVRRNLITKLYTCNKIYIYTTCKSITVSKLLTIHSPAITKKCFTSDIFYISAHFVHSINICALKFLLANAHNSQAIGCARILSSSLSSNLHNRKITSNDNFIGTRASDRG